MPVGLQTVADNPGAVVRAAINVELAALYSSSANATAPSITCANMPWYDATTDTYKMRDSANANWIVVMCFDQTNKNAMTPYGFTPGGRLTLASNTPVMNADATAQTTVYYTPYTGPFIQIYNGSQWQSFLLSQLSLALDSASGHTGYQQSGKLFDLFVVNDSGTKRLVTGPAWSSSTARGTGAGTTELQQLNGLWTNKNSMTAKFDASSSNITVAANCGTYVGTMYATANGQTGMQFKPAGGAGGVAPILGVWNAYNRITVRSSNKDTTGNWTYATVTWRAADASTNNRISWIDGLQQSHVGATYECASGSATAGSSAQIGISIDTVGTPVTITLASSATATLVNNIQNASVLENFPPQLGLHFVQAVEQCGTAATNTFNTSGTTAALILTLEM